MKKSELPEGAVVLKPDASNYVEVAGKIMRGDVVQLWRRYAAISAELDRVFERRKGSKERLSGLTLRGPSDGASDWLLVARASRGSERIVAFHRGRSCADCVEGFACRLRAGTVDWRDDRPISQNGDSGAGEGREALPPLVLE